MDLYKLNKKNLEIVAPHQFELEKDIQDIVEDNIEELFNLQLVKSEFVIQSYRIDSLCFDQENNSFVIIEYKRSSSFSVSDQGLAYLSAMLKNKADVVLEYNESIGINLKRDQVDWSQSRVIFISPSFNSYQMDSAKYKDIPVELWQIKRFCEGLIGLDQIASTSTESIKTVMGKNNDKRKVLDEVSVYDEESKLNKSSPRIKELYAQLKDRMSYWEGIKFKTTKAYIGIYRGSKLKIYLDPQKERIKFRLLSRVDFDGNVKAKKVMFDLDDPKKISTLHEEERKEQYQIFMEDDKNLDYVVSLLKQKYDS